MSELSSLIDAVAQARALVSSTQDAIQGRANVYLKDGKLAFRGTVQDMAQKRRSDGRQGVA